MGRCALPLYATALTAALLAAASANAGTTKRFCGYAYGADDAAYRYTEHHRHQYANGRWLGGSIEYVATDGSRIGLKTLSFDSNPFIPEYRLELFEGRYVEGIERVGKSRVTAFRKEFDESKTESERVEFREPAAADSGFHALIADRLPALLKGGEHRFDFVVAGALDHFRFRVKKTGSTRFEGRDAVKLVAEPDSLLSWVVDGLELIYEPTSGKLLEYRGPTNLRDRNGDGYDVRIVFASEVPPGAPAPAVQGCEQT